MTREELEQKLYDLRYDMDCIADGGQELKQAIAGLTAGQKGDNHE